MLSMLRSHAKSVFGILDPKRLSYITQPRIGRSVLNFHYFNCNFRDTIHPMCPTSDGVWATELFMLHSPPFDEERRDLLAAVFSLLRPFGYINLSNKIRTEHSLYDDKDRPMTLKEINCD